MLTMGLVWMVDPTEPVKIMFDIRLLTGHEKQHKSGHSGCLAQWSNGHVTFSFVVRCAVERVKMFEWWFIDDDHYRWWRWWWLACVAKAKTPFGFISFLSAGNSVVGPFATFSNSHPSNVLSTIALCLSGEIVTMSFTFSATRDVCFLFRNDFIANKWPISSGIDHCTALHNMFNMSENNNTQMWWIQEWRNNASH